MIDKNYKKLLNIFLNDKAILSVVITLVVLESLYIVNIFYKSIFNYLTEYHLFEIITLACLTEILFLLIKSIKSKSLIVLSNETESMEKIKDLIKEYNVDLIKIFSAGLSSRMPYIKDFLDNKALNIRLLYQHPDDALDKRDAKLAKSSISILLDGLTKSQKDNLQIKQYYGPASFRTIILCKNRIPLVSVLGWYTYYHSFKNNDLDKKEKETRITGRRNKQILLERTSSEGKDMIDFADSLFSKYWHDDLEGEKLDLG